MKLSVFKDIFSKNKKLILFVVAFALLVSYDFSFAAEQGGLADDISTGVQYLFKIIGALLGILTAFVSIFLSPGWVNGEIFGMTVYLKEIWVLISNVVYFLFAFILIWIALMNILGKGDKWELKQALPRFIVGVLIVPFSWFFVQFIISMSSILTVSVLSLPYDSFGTELASNEAANKNDICKNYVLTLGTENNTGTPGEDGYINEFLKCKSPYTEGQSNEDYTSLNTILQGEGDSLFSIIAIYTYGIISLENIDQLSTLDISQGFVGKSADLALKLVFDAVFIVMYFILMVALFMALFSRGIWLWLYAMFSPLFGLLYFFDKKEGGGDGAMSKFNIKEFIGLAMVPVYVSAALSFGLLFLFVASNGLKEGNDPIVDGDKIEFAGFSFTINGASSNSENSKSNAASINEWIFNNGLGSALGKFIIEIFGLVILWLAVMAALKQSTITQTVTQPIADFGKSVGDLAMKSPTYAPILPGGLSTGGLKQAASQTKSYFEQKSIKTGSDFLNKHTPFGSETVEAKMLANEIHNAGKITNKTLKDFKEQIAGKTMTDIASDVNLRSLMKEFADTVGVELKNPSSKEEIAKALREINAKNVVGKQYQLYGRNITNDNLGTLNNANAELLSSNSRSNPYLAKKKFLEHEDIKDDLKNGGEKQIKMGNIILNISKSKNGDLILADEDISALADKIEEAGLVGVLSKSELISKFEGMGFNETYINALIEKIRKELKKNATDGVKIFVDDEDSNKK